MKKNILTKLGGLFLGLTMGLGVAVGATEGHEVKAASGDSYSFTATSGESTDKNWSYTTSKGGGTSDPAISSSQLRLYPGNSITFSGASGVTLTSASFVCVVNANKKGTVPTGWNVDNGSITSYSSSLTAFTVDSISANSFKISIEGSAGNVGLTGVAMTFSGGGGGTTTNYTVTFDANGHGTAPAAATVASGGKVTKPADPTASGYTFGGWYRETGCTNEYDFNTAVTSSFTLYAKWTEESGGGGDATGSYTLVTSLSDLKNGDSVVIATDEPANGVTGVTGFSGSKDATVSTTLSEFLEYTVEVSGTDYYLKDDKANNYIAKPTGNEFKYGTKGAISVDANGHMMSNNRYLCVNSGSYRFYTSIGSYKPFFLYKVGQAASLVSISTLSGTVSARTGDTSWKIENVLVTGVLSDSANVVDVSKYVNVFVVESVPTIEQDGTMNVTLKATGKTETAVSKTVTVSATLKAYNPYAIENIYSAQKGENVTIDGIYMGDLRDAIVIMSGQYGADIYYGTGKVPAHSYVAGETKLTVTGTIDVYNNLVEVKTPTVSVLTDSSRIAKIATPEIYIADGTETSANLELAARKTNATGYIKSITDKSGNKDTTFCVNGTDINMYVGSAFLVDGVLDTLTDSLNNQTEITVEGFTSFFTNFQIQFTGLVEKKVDYLAENFAQELLELTDAVCNGYDGKTNNKDALNNVWLTLQDADHYLGLASTEQAKLADASASATGSDIEKAMARYDYLVGKYGLTNFVVDRTIQASSPLILPNANTNSDTAMLVIIVTSIVSIGALGVLITIKKRKSLAK